MTAEELIFQLQQLPSDVEVCVGNNPIRYVDGPLPYYYDGRLSYVTRGMTDGPYPIKCGWRNKGDKIKLALDTVEDAIFENPNIEVEYPENDENRKTWVEEIRAEARQHQDNMAELRKHHQLL